MKSKILVVSASDAKKQASKIISKLRDNQFDSTAETSDLPQTGVVVIILSKNIDTDASAIKVLDYCDKNQVAVIPFVSSKQDKSLFGQYFLNNHLWIDNIEVPLDDSVDDLLDLLKNNFGILVTKGGKKVDKLASQKETLKKSLKAKSTQSSQNIDNQKWKILSILFGIIICILLFVVISGENKSNQQLQASTSNGQQLPVQSLSTTLKQSENNFVGHWVMSEYYDNQYRPTREDSLQLQQSVSMMIGNCQMIFNKDKTFSRIGFSAQVEKGTWEYDPSGAYLKLLPAGSGQPDYVQIQEVTADKLIIVVNEKIENSDIITKITFKRKN